MLNFELGIRLYVVLLWIVWRVYWKVIEKKADSEKPKTVYIDYFTRRHMMHLTFYTALSVVLLQLLLDIPIFPIHSSQFLFQIVGVLLASLGCATGVKARYDLGTNWSNAYEYQIKKQHALITSGIYSFVRHPIYIGLSLLFVGSELVVGSWLFLPALLLIPANYLQAKREEKLLLTHFGKSYQDYMKRSKMFIPFVW